jgi:Ca2+-binding RTX toxin-like protein
MRGGDEKLRKGLTAIVATALAIGLAGSPQISSPAAAAKSLASRAPVGDVVKTRRAGGATIVLAGGAGPDDIRISLSSDGRTYWINSATALEAGGSVCSNPPGEPDQLSCPASAVAGFDFNGGPGDDTTIVGKTVPVPVALRGGDGEDLLVGGGGDDLLIGGPGENVLIGGPGDDRLYGGPEDDLLIGGPGYDSCNGGGGENAALGCEVTTHITANCSSPHELLAAIGPSRCARWARRHPGAISRLASLRR